MSARMMKSRGRSHGVSRISPHGVGVIVLVGLILVGLVSFQKSRLDTMLSSGDEVRAEFERHYKLKPYASRVKLAGVVVGSVTDVDETDRDTVVVSMKVAPGVREKLGSEPSAMIRPTLVVGGRYFVELAPGGSGVAAAESVIPVERTRVPVELDRVLSTVDAEAGAGLRGTLRQTDATLRGGGRKELKELLRQTPEALERTGQVMEALRGQRPQRDLSALVSGFQSTAATLTQEQGQLAETFASFNDTTAALAAASGPMAEAVGDGPRTLQVTRAGRVDLRGSLDKVTATARDIRPSVKALEPVLDELEPVLHRTGPLLHDLDEVLDDARPLVRDLGPSAVEATRIFGDVRGPVMSRINGELAEFVLNPWTGTGPYEHGGNSHKLYEELAYLTVAGARVFQTHDRNGSQGRLMAGVGGRTLGGAAFPNSLEQYLEDIFGMHMPRGPQEGKEPGGDGQHPIIEAPGGDQ